MSKENLEVMKASAEALGVTIPEGLKDFQAKDMLASAILKEYGETEYDCGDCKNLVPMEYDKACPFCGAKFEGGDEDAETETDTPVTGKTGGESKADKELSKLDKDLADIDGGTGKSAAVKSDKTKSKKTSKKAPESAPKSKKPPETGKDMGKGKTAAKSKPGAKKETPEKKAPPKKKLKKKEETPPKKKLKKKVETPPKKKLKKKKVKEDPYVWYEKADETFTDRVDLISDSLTERFGDEFENPVIMRNYIGFWIGETRVAALERSGRLLLNTLPPEKGKRKDGQLAKKLDRVTYYAGADERKANRYGKVGIFIQKSATDNQIKEALKSYFSKLPL